MGSSGPPGLLVLLRRGSLLVAAGSRRCPPDIRTIDIFGVKAHGRDNVTVVVPISLTEHPELQRQGADWEELVRYRSRLFAQEFKSRSSEARVAAIALHDGVGKWLGVCATG